MSITVRLYADDTKSHPTISDHLDQLQLQCDLNNLQRWSAEHCMKFNIKKCRQTCVTKEKNPLHYYYNISSTRAPRGTKVKDLGVSVSHNLSWNDHVGIVLDKANKMLGLLYRTCWTVTSVLYLCYIKPSSDHITSCIAWQGNLNLHLNLLTCMPYITRNYKMLTLDGVLPNLVKLA